MLRFTVASPRGVATATHPFCLPSVEGACKVMLPCRLMAALPCGQYTVPFAATTGVSPMTVNDSACGAPPIVPTCSRAPCGPLMLSTAPSEVRYPYTVPSCVTAIFPPDPSFMFGLSVVGLTDFTSAADPTHTLPVLVLMKAAVLPPIMVSISVLMAVLPVSLIVEAAILLALVPSEITVLPLCWATSKREAADETPASTSLFFALNRAALRSFNEVIHTVPSSSCTCRCVTELTMNAPAMMPSSRSSMTIGVIHRLLPDGNSSLRTIDPKRS